MLQNRNYFLQGFSLLNRNIGLYLIAVLFTLTSFIIQYLNKLLYPLGLGLIATVLSIVAAILSLSYSLSIPLLLSYKQQGESMDYHTLWKIIFRNAKRLIIPFMILIPIIFIALIIIGILLIINLHIKNPQQFIQLLGNNQPSWNARNPSYVFFISVLAVVFSFFTFSSIFFSIENFGIFSAWVKGVAFSFRNIGFITLVIVILLATNFISSIINLLPFDRGLASYISLIPVGYIHLGVLASSLLYYQHRRAKNLDKTQQP